MGFLNSSPADGTRSSYTSSCHHLGPSAPGLPDEATSPRPPLVRRAAKVRPCSRRTGLEQVWPPSATASALARNGSWRRGPNAPGQGGAAAEARPLPGQHAEPSLAFAPQDLAVSSSCSFRDRRKREDRVRSPPRPFAVPRFLTEPCVDTTSRPAPTDTRTLAARFLRVWQHPRVTHKYVMNTY